MNLKLQPRPDVSRMLLSRSAAAMYGGAGVLSLIEYAIPGGPQIALAPGLAALGFALVLLLVGARLPMGALAALGPLGATLIAISLATSGGAGDGAVLYMWPVLWEAYFFGLGGTILIVAWIGFAQALSLHAITSHGGDFDRWLDVFVSVAVVGSVVELLARRNRVLHSRLAAEVRLDQLTGLLNRRGFEERAMIEVARARRERGLIGIVTFDLDNFKGVNDLHGHATGDLVLVHLGETFRAHMRDTDVLARMGGEEFVALLPGGGIGDAWAFAERVRVGFLTSTHPSTPSVTVSAGVAAGVGPDAIDTLLHQADEAMYEAKSAGRNRTTVYRDPSPRSPIVA